MKVSQGNSLGSYLKQTKVSFFSFTKSENRRAEQVLPGAGEGASERGEDVGRGCRRVNMGKHCVHMDVNGKMRPVDTQQFQQEESEGRRDKEEWWREFKYDTFDIS
jgi:hypothetical protein